MLRRDNLAGPSAVHSDNVASMTLSVICSRPRGLGSGFGFVVAFVRAFVADFAVVFAAVDLVAVALAAVDLAVADVAGADFFGRAAAELPFEVGMSILVSARPSNTGVASGRCIKLRCRADWLRQPIGRRISIERSRDVGTAVSADDPFANM
jgi:hypothetical protein